MSFDCVRALVLVKPNEEIERGWGWRERERGREGRGGGLERERERETDRQTDRQTDGRRGWERVRRRSVLFDVSTVPWRTMCTDVSDGRVSVVTDWRHHNSLFSSLVTWWL